MIIFQTAGSGDASGFRFDAHLLGDLGSVATTYRESDYIHRLNRTLQAEMRAVSAYRSVGLRLPEKLTDAFDGHQRAGRELVRLVIANRGVPEDRSALSFGLTRTVVQILSRVPSRLAERVTSQTLLRLETHLEESYQRLLEIAPARDRLVLNGLLQQAERFAGVLAEAER
jgi:hypothetical protein